MPDAASEQTQALMPSFLNSKQTGVVLRIHTVALLVGVVHISGAKHLDADWMSRYISECPSDYVVEKPHSISHNSCQLT